MDRKIENAKKKKNELATGGTGDNQRSTESSG